MKVAELMTQPVRTCSTSDSLECAARIMWETDCGVVPIVDDEGHTVGIVTDRDACMAAYTQGKPLAEIPVSVAASHTLVSVQPDDTLDLAQVLMESARIRRLPVLDRERRPVGLVGLADVTRHVVSSAPPDGIDADVIARTLAAISQPLEEHIRHDRAYGVRYADGAWRVFDRDEHPVSDRIESISNAVLHAKDLARRDGSAQIFVYDTHGNLMSEFIYQREQRHALSDDHVATIAASHPTHVRQLKPAS